MDITIENNEIPIFFAVDDNYIPFLAVAIKSLIDNSSRKNNYKVIILNSGINNKNMRILKNMEKENFKIIFFDVKNKIKELEDKLLTRLRDYYSMSIYYRIFIASLFPEYKKGIYLDSDIVIIDDIANLYAENIENYLVGAISDEVVAENKVFQKYTKEALDLDPNKYFNSGVLLMNLDNFRKEKIEEKFIYLLKKYNFDVIAPDQDYLNVLCKGKVKYLSRGWDRMPNNDESFDNSQLHLIHFNMFKKPWNYSNVLYEEYFWKYAVKTYFYKDIINMKNAYTSDDIKKDNIGVQNMIKQSFRIIQSKKTFKDILKDNYLDNL